jgi:hypothetical protein
MNAADYMAQNAIDWKRLLDELFPLNLPTRAYWTEPTDIIKVLNHIGSVNSSNYTFFANGGGLVLTGAKPGNEPGTIELQFQGAVRVCKPDYLLFEGQPVGNDYQWSYFRLEEVELLPTGIGHVSTNNHGQEERLTELTPGQYDTLDTWEYRADREQQLPSSARVVARVLKGSMVIFQKSSEYYVNGRGTDSGLHAGYDPDQFKHLIGVAREEGVHTLYPPPIF